MKWNSEALVSSIRHFNIVIIFFLVAGACHFKGYSIKLFSDLFYKLFWSPSQQKQGAVEPVFGSYILLSEVFPFEFAF